MKKIKKILLCALLLFTTACTTSNSEITAEDFYINKHTAVEQEDHLTRMLKFACRRAVNDSGFNIVDDDFVTYRFKDSTEDHPNGFFVTYHFIDNDAYVQLDIPEVHNYPELFYHTGKVIGKVYTWYVRDEDYYERFMYDGEKLHIDER